MSSSLGPQPDGTYNSPYSATIYYDPTNLFETGCATYYPNVQRIPVPSENDLNHAADAAEYITNTVIMFGEKYNSTILAQFKERGFKNIIVLGSGEADADIQFLAPMTFLDQMPFNGIQRFVMEYIAKSAFGSFIPSCAEITPDTARALCTYIKTRMATPTETYAKQLIELASLDGFEMIDNIIQRGIGIQMGRDLCAAGLISNGRRIETQWGSILQVQQSAVNMEVISATHDVDYVALYRRQSPMDVILATINGTKRSSIIMFEITGTLDDAPGYVRATLTDEQATLLGFGF